MTSRDNREPFPSLKSLSKQGLRIRAGVAVALANYCDSLQNRGVQTDMENIRVISVKTHPDSREVSVFIGYIVAQVTRQVFSQAVVSRKYKKWK